MERVKWCIGLPKNFLQGSVLGVSEKTRGKSNRLIIEQQLA